MEFQNKYRQENTRYEIPGRTRCFRRKTALDPVWLDITIDQKTDVQGWSETLALADRFKLTMYDAAYLELAQRRQLPLATFDNALRAGANRLGLELASA
jgi:predicted nucleic acid-binding protein